MSRKSQSMVILLLLSASIVCHGLATLPHNIVYPHLVRPRGLRLAGGEAEGFVPAGPGNVAGPHTQAAGTGGAGDPAASLINLLGMLSGAGKPKAETSNAADSTADFGMGMSRSMKAMGVYNEIKASYDALYQNTNATHNREPTKAELSALHILNAERCLALARENGGIYNKAAQFAASLQGGAGERGVPDEYIRALRICTDHAPAKPFSVMDSVLIEEFGMSGRQLFQQIDEHPIAAASLAQVHRAVLKDGREVAVKIIYPCLRRELASDFAVFKTLGTQIKPGGFDLQWLVRDFEQALMQELNFTAEALNSEQCKRRLAHVPGVRVPSVVWEYTRSSVLVTEYVHGMVRLNDEQELERHGFDKMELGHLVADVFSEMALCHGIMHGDPHLGNVYARKHNGNSELVILDHGLYIYVGDSLRRDVCNLFLSCIERRKKDMIALSAKLAGPLHRFLPLLLSPWFVFGGNLTLNDLRSAMKGQIPKTVSLKEVGQCIESLHTHSGSILGMLHSIGYTRGLLKALSYPENLRLKSVAKYAVLGLLSDSKERERALHDMINIPSELHTAIYLSRFQVDVTMCFMVPMLMVWKMIVRPAAVAIVGFALLAAVNIASFSHFQGLTAAAAAATAAAAAVFSAVNFAFLCQ